MTDEIRAAGGVVIDDDGRVLLVHRPHHEDWSLPKGKLDPGEAFEDAAVREVREETGVVGALGEELAPSHYEVSGTPKVVRWWRMTVVEIGPSDAEGEVDEVRWLSPADALALLTHETDRALVAPLA